MSPLETGFTVREATSPWWLARRRGTTRPSTPRPQPRATSPLARGPAPLSTPRRLRIACAPTAFPSSRTTSFHASCGVARTASNSFPRCALIAWSTSALALLPTTTCSACSRAPATRQPCTKVIRSTVGTLWPVLETRSMRGSPEAKSFSGLVMGLTLISTTEGTEAT